MATHAPAEVPEVVAPSYQGPERRTVAPEKREGYLVERKLRMDMLNELGRKAIFGIAVFAAFWIGRVETSLRDLSTLQQEVAVLVSTVKDLAATSKASEDRDRDREKSRTEVLLQLKELNGQITALRAEAQARVVSGRGNP